MLSSIIIAVALGNIAVAQSSKNEMTGQDTTVFRLKQKIEELEKSNRELQARIAELSNPLSIAALADWKLAQGLQGCSVLAQNDQQTFLGVLDFNGRDINSIFNDAGLHGSSVGIESIWKEVGLYGSEVGLYSARNGLCLKPPVIVKQNQIVGHLTINKLLLSPARFDPNELRFLASRIQGKR